tara:strand:- start:2170 stop:2391 length:222 start_codon:yes stop_codon:yes gene_type:complete
MTTYFLEDDLARVLRKIDIWLKNQQFNDLTNIVEASRERITKIQEKGYYTDTEKSFLNELRKQYVDDINQNEV